MTDIDLAALADQFVDDELDQAAWDQARAVHGPALDAALMRARAIRAALRGLQRPELPTDLRLRLLAEAPRATITPAALAFPRPARWWRVALPTALAALLLVVVMLARQPTQHAAPAPIVARHDANADDVLRKNTHQSDQHKDLREQSAANGTMAPAAYDKAADGAPRLTSETDEELKKHIPVAEVAARQRATEALQAGDHAGNVALTDTVGKISEKEDLAGFSAAPAAAVAAPAAPLAPAAPPALAAKAAAPIAAPVVIAARWHSTADTPDRDAAPAKPKAEADGLRREAAAGAAPNEAATGLAAMAEVAPQADDQRHLRITLRNPGTAPLRFTPGSVHLVGIASSGRTLWRTPLQRDLTIPAGESATWDESVPVIPPGVAHLRIEAQGVHSANILP